MKGDFKSLMRLLMRHLPKLDLYGGAVRTDPARFPKSHIGAVVSLICFGAAIALIAINASRLYTAAAAARDDGLSTIVSMGTEYIKFNAFFEDPDTGQLTGVDDGRWDLPSLMIECSSNIEFFNRDARKLYKIELRDNSGIHRGLTSSKQSTPVASGLYKRVPVALGSVNQDLEPGVGEKQASVSLAASLGFKKLHSGQEIIRVLKKMKNGTQEFFDHKAHAFVRLLPWQMQSVKSCQLQVWLANQGQYLAMLEEGLLFDRANYADSLFDTLSTTSSTWRPSNFGQMPPFKWTENHITLLKLSSKMTREALDKFRARVPAAQKMQDGDFMDWRVEFTYLNNFVNVVADYRCDNEGSFNKAYATISNLGPGLNDTFIILDKPVAEADADNIVDGRLVWPIPPFEVMLSFVEVSEVAKVTDIQTSADGRQNMTLERARPTDFVNLGGIFPRDWQCPIKWYNDGKSCNCECGAPDPDCEPGKDLPVLACPMPYAKLDTGSFCSAAGHCAKSPATSTDIIVQVSQGCSKISRPGEVVLRGLAGTEEAYAAAAPGGCAPCPGDVHYDGQMSLDSDHRFKCNVRTSGNIQADINPMLEAQAAGLVKQVHEASATAAPAQAPAPPAGAPAITTPPPASGDAGTCVAESKLWNTCMQSDTTSFASGMFVRFAHVGMSFPLVSPADKTKPPVPVDVWLGDSVTYKGRLMMSVPPSDDLQTVVVGPDPKLAEAPVNRFEQIKCLLVSAVNYDSTSMDVILLSRAFDGSPINFRPGIDKNFIVRLGSSLIPILDTVPAEHLTGLAGRQVSTGAAVATTTFFNLACDSLVDGVCTGAKTSDEGLMMTLRLVRPVPISKGKTRVVTAFDLCQAPASSADGGGAEDGGTAAGTTPAPASSRRLLQETTPPPEGETAAGTWDGAAADGIDPDDPSTCPTGKRYRIVTTSPLFPAEMMALAGIQPEPAGSASGDEGGGAAGTTPAPASSRRLLQETTPAPGGDGDGAAGGADAAPLKYVFPVERRPIVIIRSRGRVAEVRLVNSTEGNVLELDGDVEGNIYWPSSVETTYDGKPHSCVPEHHSCMLPLYNLQMSRTSEAYDPVERFQSHPETEPTTSPENLDLELALYTVPEGVTSQSSSASAAAQTAAAAEGAQGATAGGTSGGSGGAAAAQTPAPTTPSSERRAEAEGEGEGMGGEGKVGSTPAPGLEGTVCAGETCRLNVGAADDRFCPNLPLSAEESGTAKKYTAFNWDKWRIKGDRDYDMINCLDKPIELPACKDLNDVAAAQLKNTCLKAMPPTSTYSFVSKLPVNNKWRVPATFLQIMRGINLPEFDMDFSLIYSLQYSGDTLEVENEFARTMETGDYLDTNNFTIYNGATEFQGLGAGYDGYRKLAEVLPANQPVLRNTLVLGVDTASTLRDLEAARAQNDDAANMWPKNEQNIKLILERFGPLQIEWELSSIGGRADEQVVVMQPGYEYKLEALLQIRPIYSSDVWESARIERWERQVVSTSASRSKLSDASKAHQVVVRYHLEFDPLVRAQTFRKAFTIKYFAESVGAATGFIVLGAIILNGLRRLRPAGPAGKRDAQTPQDGQQLEFAQ